MRKNKLFSPKLTKKEMNEFEIHVKHNMKRAYFTALGFVGSHDSAVDLSQEAFVRAYKNYKKFDNSKKFFTWYYKILKNLCLNFIRDSKKTEKKEFLLPVDDFLSPENPEIGYERKEIQKEVQEALFKLSDEDREIIILKEFQEISYKEIANLLEIPIGTVMSKLFYARKKLAKSLQGVLR